MTPCRLDSEGFLRRCWRVLIKTAEHRHGPHNTSGDFNMRGNNLPIPFSRFLRRILILHYKKRT